VCGVRFTLLGTLVLAGGAGDPVAVPGARQRTLLATLLLSANVPVSSDALAEAVWDGSPPPGAAATLRSHVRRLRQALGPEVGARITACDPGYLIRVQEPELDVLQFEALCREAAAARRAGRWEDASATAARALGLWRGTPLLDVPSQVLRDRFVPRLEQMRLQVLEDHIEADLRLHRHDQLVPELRDLTSQHPMRERFHAQLMEALACTGRQAEALDAYRQARRALVDELGIEPGPQLRLLHQKILDGDPALAAPQASRDDTPRPPAGRGLGVAAVPRQLPAAVPHFTGRKTGLAELTAWQHAARADGTALVAVIDGAPGIGKTALAVHWANQRAAEFPDGQLYVNLRGFDPSGEATPAGTAIRGFLDAFQVPAERIPHSQESQAALYRSLLAGKRVLIVVDNAREAGQVRPLLPGSPGCIVVITSRARLTGLAAAEGARLLTLDVLSANEARELLTSRIGAVRAQAEPGAVDELARLCGRLPLALTVAAARAAARPRTPLAVVSAELADTDGRLHALETADPVTSVRTVFSWSYQNLDEGPARMFRLLGVHPGPDVTVQAAAALAQVPPGLARTAIQTLTMANLLEEHVPGRFTFHDLLRAYAAGQAAALEAEAERHAAVHRVLSYYLHTSHAAALLLEPSREPVTLAPPQPGVTPEHLATSQQALAWFGAEHRVLISAVTLAARAEFDACAWQLAWALDNYLDWHGHWQEWAAIQRTALAAATRLGDTAGQATARRLLGHTSARLGDYEQARAHLSQCLELYRQLGDRTGEGRVHQTLGWVAERQNRYADALGHAEQALALYQATGDKARQAAALNNAGWCHALLGGYQQARQFARQALAMFRELGHLPGEAAIWDSLGYAEHKLGNIPAAADCYHRALNIVREVGDRYHEAEFLTHLGEVHHTVGDLAAARGAWRQALDILDDLHHPDAAQARAKLRQLGPPRQTSRTSASTKPSAGQSGPVSGPPPSSARLPCTSTAPSG